MFGLHAHPILHAHLPFSIGHAPNSHTLHTLPLSHIHTFPRPPSISAHFAHFSHFFTTWTSQNAKQQQKAADKAQLEKEIHLVKAPAALRKEKEKLRVAAEERMQE